MRERGTRRVAQDAAIDLQLHTVYSDGQWLPETLFAYLAAHQFRVVAITDHDRVDRGGELQKRGEAAGVTVIPAVEMTTSWRGLSAHLLCYAPAWTGEALAVLAERTATLQRANNDEVYHRLWRQGYAFPRQQEALASSNGVVERPVDNARLLFAHGYAPSLDQALSLVGEAGYRSITAPLQEAIEAAHVSGALAVLAHPGRAGGEIQRYDVPLLAELADDVALDGIEAHYPAHTEEQTAAYLAFAKRRGLLWSAGSDSHGPQQRLPVPYPASSCAPLLQRLGISVAI